MKKFYQKLKEKLKKISISLVAPLLIALFVAVYFIQNILIIVPAGHAGVFWSLFFGGTRIDHIYSEGLHFIFPWDKMYVYNVRVQEVYHEFAVLTKNGLKVELYISIRYQPEYKLVAMLHKKVGPDYVNVVVIPEIENVLRVLIGQLEAEEVYTTKRAIIEKSVGEAVEQIAQRYVNVDDVIIKRMVLPDNVDDSIQEKLTEKHKADAYQFKLLREEQEKERKRIEAEGLKIYHQALTPQILHWMSIDATLKLAESDNSKTIVIGAGKEGGLPLVGTIPLKSYTEIINAGPAQNAPALEPTPETETAAGSAENQSAEASETSAESPENQTAAPPETSEQTTVQTESGAPPENGTAVQTGQPEAQNPSGNRQRTRQ
jgi:regulator of protease activity HflC (stomatin/prohibitin superfamily)